MRIKCYLITNQSVKKNTTMWDCYKNMRFTKVTRSNMILMTCKKNIKKLFFNIIENQ